MVKIVGANVDLHVHVFCPEINNIDSILDTMRKNKLDIIGPSLLDNSIYHPFRRRVFRSNKMVDNKMTDEVGIIIPPLDEIEEDNTKILFNAREYNTKEGLHILTMGYSSQEYDTRPDVPIRDRIDEGLEHGALVVLDHIYADNLFTNTLGHVSEELESEIEKICKEYAGEIAIEWNGYCRPDVRWGLKQLMNSPLKLLNPTGEKVRYHDVNKKAESLSERLAEQGYNLPVIAETDLHGRDGRALKHMGRARMIVNVEGETPKEFLKSMKENIFAGDYKNVKKYVDFIHVARVFGLPILFPEKFYKPRS